MTNQLIVTADDFGLTDGVCRAIIRAHREGIVTSTSLLAVGRSYRTAVELAKATPSLAVGVHLAAVGEDPPLLPPSQVPSLVTRDGRFPLSYRMVLRRAVQGRLDPDDVRREFQAQIERVLADRLPISHLDTHQHLHLWPPVARIVVELADRFAIAAVRLPRSSRRSPLGLGVNVLASRLRRQLDAAGLRHPADFAGLDEAGDLGRQLPDTIALLGSRGAASAELNCHPGEAADPDLDRFAWNYSWDSELSALTAPSARALVAQAGFRLTTWSELGSAA